MYWIKYGRRSIIFLYFKWNIQGASFYSILLLFYNGKCVNLCFLKTKFFVFTQNLLTLPTNDIIVSNTSFTVFNLTNGTLSSDSNHGTYYLKNQTGTGYPPYILKQGQATPTDASIFRATHNVTVYGNFLSIDIQGISSLQSTNGWVACNTTANVYSIGWDSDLTTQPPEGCINIAKYSPGVLLHVGFI